MPRGPLIPTHPPPRLARWGRAASAQTWGAGGCCWGGPRDPPSRARGGLFTAGQTGSRVWAAQRGHSRGAPAPPPAPPGPAAPKGRADWGVPWGRAAAPRGVRGRTLGEDRGVYGGAMACSPLSIQPSRPQLGTLSRRPPGVPARRGGCCDPQSSGRGGRPPTDAPFADTPKSSLRAAPAAASSPPAQSAGGDGWPAAKDGGYFPRLPRSCPAPRGVRQRPRLAAEGTTPHAAAWVFSPGPWSAFPSSRGGPGGRGAPFTINSCRRGCLCAGSPSCSPGIPAARPPAPTPGSRPRPSPSDRTR